MQEKTEELEALQKQYALKIRATKNDEEVRGLLQNWQNEQKTIESKYEDMITKNRNVSVKIINALQDNRNKSELGDWELL